MNPGLPVLESLDERKRGIEACIRPPHSIAILESLPEKLLPAKLRIQISNKMYNGEKTSYENKTD